MIFLVRIVNEMKNSKLQKRGEELEKLYEKPL